jgi:hypothetical protein
MFNAKFIPNTIIIVFFSVLFADCHAKYNEIAIMKNKIFQTIGKIKEGGVILGFTDSYHWLSEFPEVKIEPIKATAKTIIIQIINSLGFSFFIFKSGVGCL